MQEDIDWLIGGNPVVGNNPRDPKGKLSKKLFAKQEKADCTMQCVNALLTCESMFFLCSNLKKFI